MAADHSNKYVGGIQQTLVHISHASGNGSGGDEIHVMEVETPAEASSSPTATSSTDTSKHRAIAGSPLSAIKHTISWILYIALIFPLVLLYTVVCVCMTGDYKPPGEYMFRTHHLRSKGVYIKMQEFIPIRYKIWRLHLVITSWLGCLLLVWLAVNLCVPGLRGTELFGSRLWKWSLLATLLSLGHPCLCLIMGYIFYILMNEVISEAHDAYYLMRGLIYSVASLIYFGCILLVWLLYFRSDQGLNPNSQGAYQYTTWTLVSLLVGAILWVLKSIVLFQWRAKAIYLRFKERILLAGFHLFFLTIIIDGMPMNHSLLPWRCEEKIEEGGVVMDDEELKKTVDDEARNGRVLKRRCIRDYMSRRHVSLQQMKIITQYVMDLAKVTLREDDAHISEIIQRYQQKIGANNESREYVAEEAIRDWMNDNEAKLLITELQAEFPDKNISEVPFLRWMVDAHKNCVSLGHTMIDAFAMISVLDTILTSCLVAVVILFWLLITELATTKVLVVIASPFLALTFMFGDTCKTFFQGVIFSFVTHPFDIGDRCIIDGVEVEIRRISILTTSCFKIGTKEKMIYPNSNLATKLIINLEGKPDPMDVIELVLDSSTEKFQLLDLQKRIENFLGDQCDLYDKSCKVLVKVVGNSIKMSIHFKHIMNVQDVSHSQFFEKKELQWSELFMEIKQFLTELHVKLATP